MKCRLDWFNQVALVACVILFENRNISIQLTFLGISNKESPFSHHCLKACAGCINLSMKLAQRLLNDFWSSAGKITSHFVPKRPTLDGYLQSTALPTPPSRLDKAAADGSLSGKKFLVRLFIINTLILMSMVVAVQVHCLRCISLHSVRRLES